VKRAGGWERVDGVLLLDKPSGVTSNAALQRARRALRAEKAGHAGTLDPLASGLLPLLFGEATKFGAELLDADKSYDATIRLGLTTTTGDAEGAIVERRPVAVSRADLDRAVGPFTGTIEQVPPMHSALKHAGRPLYAYARAGQSVVRDARRVTIHELRVDSFAGDRLRIQIRCSKGTYVRTLAEDLGAALGCGAHLAALRRTAVGPFRLGDAITLEALEGLPEPERRGWLQPIGVLLRKLPEVHIAAPLAERFAHGQAVGAPDGGAVGRVRVNGPDGRFLGVGEVGADGILRPKRLLQRPAEPCEVH
jgi:tRNA pseudouridine55 synthase